MNIEYEIFKRSYVDFDKLERYGFTKIQDYYTFSQTFMDHMFQADIMVDKNGLISGKIFDLQLEEEYTNFRVASHRGEFVNKVREEYKKILKDIRKNCCKRNYFIFEQSNRMNAYINDKYGDEPEFLWNKFPRYGVFRNSSNDKWYSIIMNIDKSKIDEGNGEIEIINVKVMEDTVENLIKKKGFYEGYHMNKKNWISIILNDTTTDEEICQLIDCSYDLVNEPQEWIVPANPNYYDMIHCFDKENIMEWKQSSNIHVGDIIYLYVGAPYSAILYKCKAVEVNIPYEYKDNNISMNRVMKIKLIKRYSQDKIPFSYLKILGIRSIRGPRKISKEISKRL